MCARHLLPARPQRRRPPALVRRALQEGHTVAHHSFAHPLLDHMSVDAAEAEINRGFAAVDAALYGKAERSPVTPFFRFPASPRIRPCSIGSSGGTLRSSAPIVGQRLEPDDAGVTTRAGSRAAYSTRGGILLFHDTKQQTAAMLPGFLRALKRRGYAVVHVTPATRPSAAAAN